VFISFEQLVILLLLALILFGPEKLPEIGEKLGRWMAKLRHASQELTREYQPFAHHETPSAFPPPAASSPYPLPANAYDFCPHCGQRLQEDFAFCPHCGRHLKEEATPQPPLAG
jgi:TatA/E family protein of Tat protein translocase